MDHAPTDEGAAGPLGRCQRFKLGGDPWCLCQANGNLTRPSPDRRRGDRKQGPPADEPLGAVTRLQ